MSPSPRTFTQSEVYMRAQEDWHTAFEASTMHSRDIPLSDVEMSTVADGLATACEDTIAWDVSLTTFSSTDA